MERVNISQSTRLTTSAMGYSALTGGIARWFKGPTAFPLKYLPNLRWRADKPNTRFFFSNKQNDIFQYHQSALYFIQCSLVKKNWSVLLDTNTETWMFHRILLLIGFSKAGKESVFEKVTPLEEIPGSRDEADFRVAFICAMWILLSCRKNLQFQC